MEATGGDNQLVRRTDLMFLPQVGSGIRATLAAAGVAEDRWVGLCARCISAQCTVCDEIVAGDEWATWLLAAGAAEAGTGGTMRFVRLRRGCCANLSCNARFYNVSFEPDPAVEWDAVSISALAATEEAKPPSLVGLAGESAKRSIVKQVTGRALAAGVLFLALWLFQQWYTGGEIPILQPAKDYTGEYAPVLDYQKETRQ